MASISLNVDGKVDMGNYSLENPGIISFGLNSGSNRDRVYLHGSLESLREFANKILTALPAPSHDTFTDTDIAKLLNEADDLLPPWADGPDYVPGSLADEVL